MRSRHEIQENWTFLTNCLPSHGNLYAVKAQEMIRVELLLDIRDLLVKITPDVSLENLREKLK